MGKKGTSGPTPAERKRHLENFQKLSQSIARRKRQKRIAAEVMVERDVQDKQWGGEEHDDAHDSKDFASLIRLRAEYIERWSHDRSTRGRFVKIAALAFANIERIDRLEEARKKRRAS
jgi:hypothetical protein